jgi:hypothetical protein
MRGSARGGRSRRREDDSALATPLLDPLAQAEPEQQNRPQAPKRRKKKKKKLSSSNLLETAPDKCGQVEIGALRKRNILFGGYTWYKRFLAISGDILSIFQRRMHCGCKYKYVVTGKYGLSSSHVSVQTDLSATAQPRIIISLSDNHGQIWLKIRTRNAADVSGSLIHISPVLTSLLQCRSWSHAFHRATGRFSYSHDQKMQQLERLLLPPESPLTSRSVPGSVLFFDQRCRALSPAELHWQQRQLVLATSALFGLHPTKARELLRLCEFDVYIMASKWLWGFFPFGSSDDNDDEACGAGELAPHMLVLPEQGAANGRSIAVEILGAEEKEQEEEGTCQICYGSFAPSVMVGGRESKEAESGGGGSGSGSGSGGGSGGDGVRRRVCAWTCLHPAHFCRDCYTRQLCTLIDQGASSALQACCPALGCTERLGSAVFENILGGRRGQMEERGMGARGVKQQSRGGRRQGQGQSATAQGEQDEEQRLQSLLERYRKFEADHFVHWRRGARWCHGRGCGRAMLLLPSVRHATLELTPAASAAAGDATRQRRKTRESTRGGTAAAGFSRQARALMRLLEAGGPTNGQTNGHTGRASEGAARGWYDGPNGYKINGPGFGYGYDVECSALCPRQQLLGVQAHCFHCLQPPHAPATCAQAAMWTQQLDQVDETGGVGAASRAEDVAERRQQRWLLEHTKPCPGCGNAIERNRGCNHMACKTCSHEFCWVCLAPVRAV